MLRKFKNSSKNVFTVHIKTKNCNSKHNLFRIDKARFLLTGFHILVKISFLHFHVGLLRASPKYLGIVYVSTAIYRPLVVQNFLKKTRVTRKDTCLTNIGHSGLNSTQRFLLLVRNCMHVVLISSRP